MGAQGPPSCSVWASTQGDSRAGTGPCSTATTLSWPGLAQRLRTAGAPQVVAPEPAKLRFPEVQELAGPVAGLHLKGQMKPPSLGPLAFCACARVPARAGWGAPGWCEHPPCNNHGTHYVSCKCRFTLTHICLFSHVCYIRPHMSAVFTCVYLMVHMPHTLPHTCAHHAVTKHTFT